jgi:hypothetical protein
MIPKGFVVITLAVIVTSVMLVSSGILLSDAEAKKSKKYKAFIDIQTDTHGIQDCWTKATIELTDGAHQLAKTTQKNNRDAITKTLTFDGKKVNTPFISGEVWKDRLTLSIRFNDEPHELFTLFKDFSKSKHDYHFQANKWLKCIE